MKRKASTLAIHQCSWPEKFNWKTEAKKFLYKYLMARDCSFSLCHKNFEGKSMIEPLLKVNEIALLDTLCSAWRHQKKFWLHRGQLHPPRCYLRNSTELWSIDDEVGRGWRQAACLPGTGFTSPRTRRRLLSGRGEIWKIPAAAAAIIVA